MNNANELVTAHMELNPNGQPVNYHPGLTKKEHAAIQIMAGLISDGNIKESPESFAEQSVKCAKALFAELEKDNDL